MPSPNTLTYSLPDGRPFPYLHGADGVDNLGLDFAIVVVPYPGLGAGVQTPTVVSAAVSTDGRTIAITFSKAIADPVGQHARFSANDGSARTFSAAALGSDPRVIELTLAGDLIRRGSMVTVGYTAGNVLAGDGGVLASFAGQSVTNNSTYIDPRGAVTVAVTAVGAVTAALDSVGEVAVAFTDVGSVRVVIE